VSPSCLPRRIRGLDFVRHGLGGPPLPAAFPHAHPARRDQSPEAALVRERVAGLRSRRATPQREMLLAAVLLHGGAAAQLQLLQLLLFQLLEQDLSKK